MRCPQGQHDNREGRRFCAECGRSLAMACPSCGFSNEPGEKFCGGGGALGSAGMVAAAKFGSPESYTPKHLAERILTSLRTSVMLARLLIRALLRQYGYRVASGSAEGFLHRVRTSRLLSLIAPLLAVMRHLNHQLAYADAVNVQWLGHPAFASARYRAPLLTFP